MDSTEKQISEWAKGYYDLIAIQSFFEEYERTLGLHGQLPDQNFLLGSGLVREDETRWCRVLGWLLDSDSCDFLALGLQTLILRMHCRERVERPLSVDREVGDSGENRFDLVLSDSKRVIVIEAKVNAPKQDDQLIRYWQSECGKGRTFHGLFLALEARRDIPRPWVPITWEQVAEYLKTLAASDEAKSCGAAGNRWLVIARDFRDMIRLTSRGR